MMSWPRCLRPAPPISVPPRQAGLAEDQGPLTLLLLSAGRSFLMPASPGPPYQPLARKRIKRNQMHHWGSRIAPPRFKVHIKCKVK
jgi:hypothetical protein